ncbi:hypothetical protein NMY22_g5127 [Coprinellus aureogranulatus]|nr:hypothetical protein NMY22_g5127 [Coprinellus aureogranulatus]
MLAYLPIPSSSTLSPTLQAWVTRANTMSSALQVLGGPIPEIAPAVSQTTTWVPPMARLITPSPGQLSSGLSGVPSLIVPVSSTTSDRISRFSHSSSITLSFCLPLSPLYITIYSLGWPSLGHCAIFYELPAPEPSTVIVTFNDKSAA